MMRMKSTLARIALGLLLLAGAAAALVVWLNLRGEAALPADTATTATAFNATPQQIERGAYLARAGNCAACHTARGGADYAGGRAIETPFGIVHASNLTPDGAHGLGLWSSAEFWRALHHGRSKDGRLLSPAFPYPSYTQVSREDSDALYAYLRSLPAVAQPNRPHELRFPYDSQAALAVWRALFFQAGEYVPAPAQSAEWNRGAYLVRGLGHCAACHAERNALGATRDDAALGGGLIPVQRWYAPSLASSAEAGVADWSTQQVVDLLKTGVVSGDKISGSVSGPMAEVVARSTQYLSDADLRAMAVYLQQLPQHQAERSPVAPAEAAVMTRGEKVYGQQCAACHGEQGQGAVTAAGALAYPPLAGNRAVTMDSAANLIRVVMQGGFAPATAGNPRPYGMPPLGQVLDDADIAAVLTYVRQSWGHAAAPVSVLTVQAAR